jgi:spermidine synthase
LKKSNDTWFIDKDSENRWIYHRVKKCIVSKRTKYQKVEIIDTHELGRMVILDGRIQSAEADESIYHEVLVHPVMISHPNPRNILILGAGEGATLREVLRHPSVRKVTMIDIDREFVELCKRHLRKWHRGSFDDPRVELIYDDAFSCLRQINDPFDIIISDISDPVSPGPAVLLYSRRFYAMIQRVLMTDGIFITHATAIHYIPHENISIRILKTLTTIFPVTAFYYEYIPSYGSLWSYATGSSKYSPGKISLPAVTKRLKERKIENLSYYDAETHARLFRRPVSLRKLLPPSI